MDIYIELETITPTLRTQISEIAWEVGFEQDRVISTFVVTRAQIEFGAAGANPLLFEVLKEGQPI
jgi:hypothetical protein